MQYGNHLAAKKYFGEVLHCEIDDSRAGTESITEVDGEADLVAIRAIKAFRFGDRANSNKKVRRGLGRHVAIEGKGAECARVDVTAIGFEKRAPTEQTRTGLAEVRPP